MYVMEVKLTRLELAGSLDRVRETRSIDKYLSC